MRPPSSAEQSWDGRHLKISRLGPKELDTRIHEAIARRAFQIGESRKFAPGHQTEDWQSAESELLRPLNCGFLVSDDKIEVNSDAACFEKGEIEICVEPRRVAICGMERVCKPGKLAKKSELIFHSLELPVDIMPSLAAARFKKRSLELKLPIASRMGIGSHAKNAT